MNAAAGNTNEENAAKLRTSTFSYIWHTKKKLFPCFARHKYWKPPSLLLPGLSILLQVTRMTLNYTFKSAQ
jgi:hypothetical protein